VKNSIVKSEVYLEEGAKALTIRMEIDWHEVSRNQEPVPVLLYHLPLANTKDFIYDVPGGVQIRKGMQMDVPGLQYGAAINPEAARAVFLASDSKYGYRGSEEGLSCTLINATTNPDPYPERGIHNIVLHVGVEENQPNTVHNLAFNLNHPFLYQSGGIHTGSLPLADQLLSIEAGTGVVSGIYRLEGSLVVRISEICGQDTTVSLALTKEAFKAELIDVNATVIRELKSSEKNVTVPVSAYSTVMVRLQDR
jgi:alpha-mannosidase